MWERGWGWAVKSPMVCVSDDLATSRTGTIPKTPSFTYSSSILGTSTKHSYSAKSQQILSRESKLMPSISVQRIGTAGLSLHGSHRRIQRTDYSAVFQSPVYSPPLWSSGQSFWLQIQRSRVRFPALPDFSK